MKEILLTTLRNKETTRSAFREVSRKLGVILAAETSYTLEKETLTIETPLANCQGHKLKNRVILIPILRAGLALLPPFLDLFPEAEVGFIGVRRDENTAVPHLYYQNLPKISQDDDVLILEPMMATGNSIELVIACLKRQKIQENKITVCSLIAAPESTAQLKKQNPAVRIILIQEDEKLNDHYFIVPGLGDFGDRYFGIEA